jgi:hypothetical protein
MAGNGVVASMQAGRARSADITSAAFATIARHLGSLPGRKKLIWITTGMPLVFNDDTERNGKTSHEYQNLSARVYAPMKMLNDGNIALYALNPTPAGLLDLASESLGTLLQLTKMTGGKVYFGSNDQAGLLRAALADTDITYTLGFYPPSEEPAGASHKLEVKLTRAAVERHPSAELRYRQSYSAETKTEAMTDKRRKQLIEAWLAEPLNATAIAFTARATPEKRPDYRLVQIGLDAGQLAWEQKDGRWLTQLEWTITPDGRDKPKGVTQVVKLNLPEAKYRNLVATGVVMENAIPVADAKGKLKTKRLSVVVIDAKSGKAGSVRIPLE